MLSKAILTQHMHTGCLCCCCCYYVCHGIMCVKDSDRSIWDCIVIHFSRIIIYFSPQIFPALQLLSLSKNRLNMLQRCHIHVFCICVQSIAIFIRYIFRVKFSALFKLPRMNAFIDSLYLFLLAIRHTTRSPHTEVDCHTQRISFHPSVQSRLFPHAHNKPIRTPSTLCMSNIWLNHLCVSSPMEPI